MDLVYHIFISLLFHVICAQISFSSSLNSPSELTTSVVVDGTSCTISDIVVTGSVSVVNGGILTTSGAVNISGGVTANGSRTINLSGELIVFGDVAVRDSTSTVVIGPDAKVSSLRVDDGSMVKLEGKTGASALLTVVLQYFYHRGKRVEWRRFCR